VPQEAAEDSEARVRRAFDLEQGAVWAFRWTCWAARREMTEGIIAKRQSMGAWRICGTGASRHILTIRCHLSDVQG
jgi:hypothetical protein